MEKKSKREEMFNRMVNRNKKHRGEFMGFQESMEDVLDFIEQELDRAREEGKKVTGETSDGYHTFNELYEHRHLLFSKLAEWKSKKHSDGTMFDDWFIAGIGKDKGEQITYHIPLRLWDSFNCEELDTAPEWDGHTANDVLKRLSKLTTK